MYLMTCTCTWPDNGIVKRSSHGIIFDKLQICPQKTGLIKDQIDMPLFVRIPLLQLCPRQQLCQRKHCLPHVDDAALFLVNV